MANGQLFTAESFENPELAAMAAIADLLRTLPDEAARLRVMRWAFGRFAPEFKRPVDAPLPAPAVAPVAPPAPPMPSPTAIVRVAIPVPTPPATAVRAVSAAAPGVTATPGVSVSEDFRRQISELGDLFPERPVAAALDGFPDYAGT